jgi:NitT/TauT family transport system permease protein
MKRLVNLHPNRRLQAVLGVLPFALVVVLYLFASEARLAENPGDKLLPSPAQIGEVALRLASEEDQRSGQVLLWSDTGASLLRLLQGVGLSALAGLVFGVVNGLLPPARATLSPFVAVLSMVPPMAVLPILFIAFGLGEAAKVVLIVFGVAPFIVRELEARTLEIPSEQLVKAQTLGASTWQIATRVVLPQVLPRLVNAVRLSLGAAWLFLIAAEAIASTEGLGYRIFLVRRYLAMDVILPYVVWITLLAFAMDWGLKHLNGWLFPWFRQHSREGGAPA